MSKTYIFSFLLLTFKLLHTNTSCFCPSCPLSCKTCLSLHNKYKLIPWLMQNVYREILSRQLLTKATTTTTIFFFIYKFRWHNGLVPQIATKLVEAGQDEHENTMEKITINYKDARKQKNLTLQNNLDKA